MPGPAAPVPIDQFAQTLPDKMTPLRPGFSFYSTEPLPEEDLREFLHDPIGALPPAVCEFIGPVRIVLAPYLEKPDDGKVPLVTAKAPPADRRLRSAYLLDDEATLFFAVQNENPSDYHLIFFNTLAHLLSRRVDKEMQGKYATLLVAEIAENVNGEVEEASWLRKQELPRRGAEGRPNVNSKLFREYVAQSFADTMSLYMHGICCDIDVEKGPRQMPSRWLRKRLETLYAMFPPPNGRPVFPEHVRGTK